jgi:2-polyprenyl-3-methyl-5-hydroxy-6-metoxy-1,4-benzoquinol methylase
MSYNKEYTNYFFELLSDTYNLVCDIGCGQGELLKHGFKNGKFESIIGCDAFPVEPWIVKITSEILPFQSNFFDLTFSTDVIEHVNDDFRFVSELVRITKHGGTILIGTPNIQRPVNKLLNLFGKLHFPRKLGVDTYGDCVHLREYSKLDIINLVQRDKQLDNISIHPFWIGISTLVGHAKTQNKYCHYLFVKAKKT